MAETNQTPTLPSTADRTPYIPLSWMAVSSCTVSALFLGLLLVILLLGKRTDPIVYKMLFFMAILGIILSFAGRRIIRNSEGTRTGERYVNASWWTCVVGGLGFVAYLMAIDLSIDRDARNEVSSWLELIVKVDPKEPTKPVNLNRAFIRTLDPQRRPVLMADDTEKLETQFRDQYIGFIRSDIVRIVERNRDKCELVLGGIKEKMERPNGIECMFYGSLKCPEGIFPFELPMRGVEGTKGREWMMAIPQGTIIVAEKVTRTPYGWAVAEAEKSGSEFGKVFFNLISKGPTAFPLAYHLLIGPESQIEFWMKKVSDTTPARWAVGSSLAGFAPFFTPEQTRYYRDDFFKLPGGGEPSPEQKSRFKSAWDAMGLLPPGFRLKTSMDKSPTFLLGDSDIQVHLPCELPFPGSEGSASRCRLIISCTDRAKVDELKRYRDEAKPEQSTAALPDNMRSLAFTWRLLRVETDLVPIEAVRNRMPSANSQNIANLPGGTP